MAAEKAILGLSKPVLRIFQSMTNHAVQRKLFQIRRVLNSLIPMQLQLMVKSLQPMQTALYMVFGVNLLLQIVYGLTSLHRKVLTMRSLLVARLKALIHKWPCGTLRTALILAHLNSSLLMMICLVDAELPTAIHH